MNSGIPLENDFHLYYNSRYRHKSLGELFVMTVISIRLSEALLHDIDHGAKLLHLARTEYIRQAVELLNAETLHKKRKEKLVQASLKVRENSMDINKEFSKIEHDPT